MENLVWIRGEILPESDANVHVLSGMAQFGLNVFEGIRCYFDEDSETLYAFRLDAHLDRLYNSCRLIGFDFQVPASEIKCNLTNLIVQNGFSCDIALRLTVFADGKGSWNSIAPISYFIAPMKKNRTNLDELTGLTACVSSWTRISDNSLPPRVKIGANYINGRFAHLAAKSAGYDLPILLNEHGNVSEGAGACLFIVKSDRLVTPSISSSILESITRDTILYFAREIGLTVEERTLDRTELYLADEIFICGTAAEITPIQSIDQFTVGDGKPGPLTVKLLEKYHNVVSGKEHAYTNWLTEIQFKSK